MSDASTDGRPRSVAVARNRGAILEVLQQELAQAKRVLEIGSGTGEHGIYFARELPWLRWSCSDRAQNHDGIRAWLQHAALQNLDGPLALDVDAPPVLESVYDAVFSANTAHIMSEAQVASMFALVPQVLLSSGRFCLYGPFKLDGQFTSDSNARFDASLRAQDQKMGIRDLEGLDQLASAGGMQRHALYSMPANNFLVVWVCSEPD